MVMSYQLKECYVRLEKLEFELVEDNSFIEEPPKVNDAQRDMCHIVGHYDKMKVCEICCKTFTLASDLKTHIHFIHSNHPTLEETLKYSFMSNLSSSHHATGRLNSPRPRSRGSNPPEAPKKKPTPNRKRRYRCDMCGARFPKPHRLREHFESVHLRLRPCRCRFCGERFSNKYALATHVTARHVTGSRFECPLCPGTPPSFGYKSTLVYHVKSAHFDQLIAMAGLTLDAIRSDHSAAPTIEVGPDVSVDMRIYACAVCHVTFKHRVHYDRHVRRVHGPSSKLACSLCPVAKVSKNQDGDRCPPPTFASKEALARHIRTVHQEVKSLACSTCGQTYRDRISLERHAKRAHNALVAATSSRPCPVPGCDKTFTSVVHLTRHFKNFHDRKTAPLATTEPGKVEGYGCEECGRLYRTPVTLRRHVTTIHQGDRKYACHLCGLAFHENAKLQRHFASRKHSDVYVTPCHYCDRRFTDVDQLNRHLEEVNNHAPKLKSDLDGKLKYRCKICLEERRTNADDKTGSSGEEDGVKVVANKNANVKNGPCRFAMLLELQLHHQTAHPGRPLVLWQKKGPKEKAAGSVKKTNQKSVVKVEVKEEYVPVDADNAVGHVIEVTTEPVGRGGKKMASRKDKRERAVPTLCEICGLTMKYGPSLKRHKIRKHGCLENDPPPS